MKKINRYTLLFSLSILFILSGCGKKSTKELLVGSWKIDNLSFSDNTSVKNKKSYQEMLKHLKESAHFTFNEDMTYVGKLDDIVLQSGTWTYDEESGTVIMKSSQPTENAISKGSGENSSSNVSILHDTVHVESVDEESMSLSLKEDESTVTAHFIREKK